jgi:hypothetical protein
MSEFPPFMVPVGRRSMRVGPGTPLRVSKSSLLALLGGVPSQPAVINFVAVFNGHTLPGVHQVRDAWTLHILDNWVKRLLIRPCLQVVLRISDNEQGYFSKLGKYLRRMVHGSYFVGIAPSPNRIGSSRASACLFTALAETRVFMLVFNR